MKDKEYYEEELKRKERLIERLREEKDLLLKTSLKQAKENQRLKEMLDRNNYKSE